MEEHTTRNRESLEAMPLVELRKLSRGKVSGGYSMKKADLIDAILAADATEIPVQRTCPPPEEDPVLEHELLRRAAKPFRGQPFQETKPPTRHPGSKRHMLDTKAKRRRRNKIASASRKANR